jgi:hypothetical protein
VSGAKETVVEGVRLLAHLPPDEVETILDGLDDVDDLWWGGKDDGETTLTIIIRRDRD